MRFSMTANGAAALVNALKGVATMPAQLEMLKQKGEVSQLAQAFKAQTQMAQQRNLDSSAALNKQKLGLINKAASDPELALDTFNRLSVLSGNKAYTPFEQGRGILGSSFNAATGDYGFGSPLAQAGVINRVGALTGVDPVTGQALKPQDINVRNLGYKGDPFDQFRAVGDTGLSVDQLTGAQTVGNAEANKLFNGVQQGKAAASNAAAAASRVRAALAGVELGYERAHGTKMPTASSGSGGGRGGAGGAAGGIAMSPQELRLYFGKTNDFGMTELDKPAMLEFVAKTRSLGIPAEKNAAAAYLKDGDAGLEAFAQAVRGRGAPAPAQVPASGAPAGSSPVARALSGAQAAGGGAGPRRSPDISAYIKPRDAVDVHITSTPQFKAAAEKLANNRAFNALPDKEKRRVVASVMAGMRGDRQAAASALPFMR